MGHEAPLLRWLDGQISDGASDDSPNAPTGSELPTCYSTARVTAHEILHLPRHIARLQRDARQIGIGEVDPEMVERAFRELSHKAFGQGTGIVRVEVSRDPDGHVRHAAEARNLGPEPATWTAITVPFPHPGPSKWSGAKLLDIEVVMQAREQSDAAGADEALILDRDGHLVEGARANVLVVLEDESLASPRLSLGSVAGIARQIISEAHPELASRTLSRNDLALAREIIATNAVRGACPIVRLDDEPVGMGVAGPWCARFNAAFQAG